MIHHRKKILSSSASVCLACTGVQIQSYYRISSFIFYLVRSWLVCIPKISFIACLEVPQKFVQWWWRWWRMNLVIPFGSSSSTSHNQFSSWPFSLTFVTGLVKVHQNKSYIAKVIIFCESPSPITICKKCKRFKSGPILSTLNRDQLRIGQRCAMCPSLRLYLYKNLQVTGTHRSYVLIQQ